MIADIITVLLLILLNGFFAMSEIAVVSAKATLLDSARKKGSKGAAAALSLKSSPDHFLSSVQVGITLIGIVNGAYGGATLSVHLYPFFKQFAFTAPYAEPISIITVVVAITYLSIVVGELVPKTIALNNPVNVAIAVARPVKIISIIFYPFVRFLAISTKLFNNLIGIKSEDNIVSEMELRALLRTASLEGVIEKEENIIHEQVFYFSDKRAKHIMTHRTDVEWVNISRDRESVISSLLETNHSRVLVCNGTLDDFAGVIVMKEFLVELYQNKDLNINDFIKKPVIVPSTFKAQRILERFRQMHNYLAVVVDEYGSLDGIITLHDIFENLVGSIPNENEDPEPDIYVRKDNSILINGEAPIEVLAQFKDDFIIDFEEIDYSTVAGFMLSHINKTPQIGDAFQYENLSFEIIDIDGNKIDKILLTVSNNEEATPI